MRKAKDAKDTIAKGITAGLTDAATGRYTVIKPRKLNVKALRRRLKMTQAEFSLAYRIPLGTLRSWEQEQRVPEGPTWAYLQVIAANPIMVQKALQT